MGWYFAFGLATPLLMALVTSRRWAFLAPPLLIAGMLWFAAGLSALQGNEQARAAAYYVDGGLFGNTVVCLWLAATIEGNTHARQTLVVGAAFCMFAAAIIMGILG